jgi:DNA replicative helicase MCM subunit Mcm2 (Cdc46/Mcm family)
VQDQDSTRILNLVDDNSELLYTEINDDDSSRNVNNKNSKEIASKDKVCLQNDPNDPNDQIEIKNVNVLGCLKLDKGNVRVIGRLGRSEPYHIISAITATCNCDKEPLIKQFNPPKFGLKEFTCSKCDFKIRIISTIHRNAVDLILQDTETLDGTDYLTCVLLDFDVRNIRVGEKVAIMGEVHLRPKFNKGSLVSTVFTNNLEYVDWNEVKLTAEDIESIQRFVSKKKDSKVIESLVEMFDVSIIGNDVVKQALLCSLVNAGDDLQSIRKHKRRNRINVLLIGEPGQAKSPLVKRAASLVPNSRCESVVHSTGKSLTALVAVENENSFLRLGPISLSGGRICGLNEIGRMTPEDQNYLLDIMEEGEYTFNKKDISAKIESPTTIIASANLKDSNSFTGSRNLNEFFDITSLSQIPLQRPLVDRFDLIVFLKDDDGDIEAVREYAEKKVESQSKVIPDYIVFLQ